MFKIMNTLKLRVNNGESLEVKYESYEETPIFDICDHDGNLVETGKLDKKSTRLSLKNFSGGQYYIFILDGPQIFTRKFAV